MMTSATPLARRYRPKRRLVWGAVILLICAPFVYVGGSFAYWFFWESPHQIAQRERLVLYKLSPSAMLAACAQIRARQALFRGNPGWNPTPPKGSDNPDPADPHMPPLIATIRPTSITIGAGGVRIELGGGFLHYGLAEQLPGTPAPLLAVRPLAPGLWFYAENGKVPPP